MGKKILVVDNAPFMRVLIKDAVEVAGHQVVGEAEDGKEAIEKYLALTPDVVTMALVMPGASGLEGLKGILKHDPHARVIVVSGLDQKQELKAAITAGAFDFIVKPFDQNRVSVAIQRATAV